MDSKFATLVKMNEVADAPLCNLRLDVGAARTQYSIGLGGKVANLRLLARARLNENFAGANL